MSAPRRRGFTAGLDRFAAAVHAAQVPTATRLLGVDKPIRTVGDTDSPSFENGYTGVLRFRLDVSGFLYLDGVVAAPGPPAAAHAVFTLPEGFRPIGRRHLAVQVSRGGVANRATVEPDGQVLVWASTGGALTVKFNGRVRFR